MTAIDMSEADRQLEDGIHAIFAKLANKLLPSTSVARIHSNELAEDGQTHIVQIALTDGRLLWISICPGEAVTCRIHCVGECNGSGVCEACGAGETKHQGSTK